MSASCFVNYVFPENLEEFHVSALSNLYVSFDIIRNAEYWSLMSVVCLWLAVVNHLNLEESGFKTKNYTSTVKEHSDKEIQSSIFTFNIILTITYKN
ncbi:hypothetical protein TSUD_342400 [Trifolium subterraneum]|nr:hypothetical protein TSUD_342400 [Trifolium subterraneum]